MNVGTNSVIAHTPDEWRAWLAEHGQSESEVWLVIYRKDSGTPSVRYHEAIEHSLCFGWIDSQAQTRDPESTYLRFTPRNPRSSWSRVNRERAARMTELGLMTEPGQAMIDLARASETWQVLADDESAAVPDDLRDRLDQNEPAAKHFQSFPPSSKRLILEWIAKAKRPDTRQRRIAQTVELAAMNIRANHPGVRSRPTDQ